jgi:hypothetical protein
LAKGEPTPEENEMLGFRDTAWTDTIEPTKKAWKWLVVDIMPVVIGRKIWSKHAMTRRYFSTVASVSDEAFALLVLENYRSKWISQVQKATDETVEILPTKYTAKGKEWDEAGIRRFSQLHQLVTEGRNKDDDKTMDWDVQTQLLISGDDATCSRSDTASVHTTTTAATRSEAFLSIPMDDFTAV